MGEILVVSEGAAKGVRVGRYLVFQREERTVEMVGELLGVLV